jgi:hypothetical protein
MNKSQRIHLDVNNIDVDKYLKIRLEQDIDTLEFLSMSIDTKDIYRDFNADYGVLVGRVNANKGIGIQNAKISIFIPVTDEDTLDGSVMSIYPYKSPRDKNADGKRYNLLPRVSKKDPNTGIISPKQPFGSFPIKEEIVINEPFLNVYKKYYKYTALTNSSGDYMIFGVPIGVQTVHMSVDITDIGKYSMTPSSMIQAGFPADLFTDQGGSIKPSTDLTDLPNIETQEISVEIIPFWGDVENFEIGITRQDFRIKAELTTNFVVFGTTMTMGEHATLGSPDRDKTNKGFYWLSEDINTNIDIRSHRPSEFTIRVFSYKTNVPISNIIGGAVNPNADIYELGQEEFYTYQKTGDFVLTVPCNRRKVITDETGVEIVVDDNSTYGVFTEFYGMMIVEYPSLLELPINRSFDNDFKGGSSPKIIRGKFKIPQSYGLWQDVDKNDEKFDEILENNNKWRTEYMLFKGGEIYGVAQFMATKYVDKDISGNDIDNIHTRNNTENKLENDYGYNYIGGILTKVAGITKVTDIQYDQQNYIVPPSVENPYFKYDFPSNAKKLGGEDFGELFGAQWLNLALIFPQIVWATGEGNNRGYNVADLYFNNYEGSHFQQDNAQAVFANLSNTKLFVKGDAYRTKFINIPRSELAKLYSVPHKGLNLRRWNNNDLTDYNNEDIIQINPTYFEYQTPEEIKTDGRDYTKRAWDAWYPYSGEQLGNKPTAYLFKGMYDNDCVKLLYDLNII